MCRRYRLRGRLLRRYYAVGLAKRMGIPVYAYDPEPYEKRHCREIAELNGVSGNVVTRDFFTDADMDAFTGRRVLVISDCEGFESALFTPYTVAKTKDWDLLIELHGPAITGLPALPSPHKTSVIASQPRTMADHRPELDGIGTAEVLLSEYRGERQHWLWCDSQ